MTMLNMPIYPLNMFKIIISTELRAWFEQVLWFKSTCYTYIIPTQPDTMAEKPAIVLGRRMNGTLSKQSLVPGGDCSLQIELTIEIMRIYPIFQMNFLRLHNNINFIKKLLRFSRYWPRVLLTDIYGIQDMWVKSLLSQAII